MAVLRALTRTAPQLLRRTLTTQTAPPTLKDVGVSRSNPLLLNQLALPQTYKQDAQIYKFFPQGTNSDLDYREELQEGDATTYAKMLVAIQEERQSASTHTQFDLGPQEFAHADTRIGLLPHREIPPIALHLFETIPTLKKEGKNWTMQATIFKPMHLATEPENITLADALAKRELANAFIGNIIGGDVGAQFVKTNMLTLEDGTPLISRRYINGITWEAMLERVLSIFEAENCAATDNPLEALNICINEQLSGQALEIAQECLKIVKTTPSDYWLTLQAHLILTNHSDAHGGNFLFPKGSKIANNPMLVSFDTERTFVDDTIQASIPGSNESGHYTSSPEWLAHHHEGNEDIFFQRTYLDKTVPPASILYLQCGGDLEKLYKMEVPKSYLREILTKEVNLYQLINTLHIYPQDTPITDTAIGKVITLWKGLLNSQQKVTLGNILLGHY